MINCTYEKLISGELKLVKSSYTPQSNVSIYIKYRNVQNVCKNTTNILAELGVSFEEFVFQYEYGFNEMLLTAHGFIDAGIASNESGAPICTTRVNYTNVVNLMIVLILVSFSILFIIVLYNAFLITINERQKEYAVLNSVGGTEGQVLKIIFIEAILIGLVSIIIGGMLSIFIANNILHSFNNVLIKVGYHFELAFSLKYMLLALFIIVINIYMAVLIPSVKASTTSVIQGIRRNKQIRYKRKNGLLVKILPIEGKLAIKNVKRNKSKYRIITVLLVICMTSYIAISTYIAYQKETANLVNEYDVDAILTFSKDFNMDYKKIFDEYEKKYNDKIEYIEYKCIDMLGIVVEPKEAIIDYNRYEKLKFNEKDKIYERQTLKFDEETGEYYNTFEDDEADKISVLMTIFGLDDKTYNKYIKKINAKYGDIIIYNNVTEEIPPTNDKETSTYIYNPLLRNDITFNLNIDLYRDNHEIYRREHKIIDSESLNGNYVLTDELIDGFAELKVIYRYPAIFVNIETYNKMIHDIQSDENIEYTHDSLNSAVELVYVVLPNMTRVKIKCNDIANLKTYIEDIKVKNNIDDYIFGIACISLENQEKVIYTGVIELLLKVIIIAIVTIGTVSAINVISASLVERKEDFNILHRLGTTKRNMRKMLIYEGVYMFIKATIIAIIISIPIIWKIVRQIESVIILNKSLIPYGEIVAFFAILFAINILIMIYSSRMVKEE